MCEGRGTIEVVPSGPPPPLPRWKAWLLNKLFGHLFWC
jgi:hypothetical protein